MAESLVMMALSPTMQDGVIAEWLVAEGASFKPGDALCEVETDKASMPYEAPKAGTLLKILKAAGQRAAVGENIAVIGKPGEDWTAVLPADAPRDIAAPSARSASPPAGPSTQSAFPALGPAPSQAPEPAAMPIPAALPPLGAVEVPDGSLGTPASSPLARALARDRGIDLSAVRGSGPRGRIVKRDILSYDASVAVQPAVPPLGTAVASSSRLRGDRVPLSRMRTLIAERLGGSYSEAPHFFVRAAVDMERILELRASVNEGRDQKLGLNAFIMRLVARALERHPIVNSSWEGDAIRYRPSADIGLAVSLEGGLVTPVVRACERKGVEEIDAELSELVRRARAGGLSPEEYSEASFTISNLGSYGVEEFTAIINPPGSAILALGAVTKEAVVREDAIVARRTMRITLSSDHRVIDGAVAAAFAAELKALIEEPAKALL